MTNQTTITQLLTEYSELLDEDLTNHHVYGSPMRPMSSVWACIPNAVFMQVNKQETGYHTYVATPETIEQDVIDRYEMVRLKHQKELAIQEGNQHVSIPQRSDG